jgi:hypothetical protein
VVDLDLKPYLSLGRNEILLNPQSDADGMILRSEIKQSNSALTAIKTDDTWCNLDNGNVTVVAPYSATPWSTWHENDTRHLRHQLQYQQLDRIVNLDFTSRILYQSRCGMHSQWPCVASRK